MPRQHIRNTVRLLREEKGMTQADLARACGCTRQTIIMLEQERYVPSLSLAFAVARVLGASVENVFREDTSDEEN
ncbi:helix-turn-helix transcriptional regulator [bacterium]|nr:helix-turn-helix transcriptional regulator [bacterium]